LTHLTWPWVTASHTHQLTGWFSLLLILVTGVSIIISAHAWDMGIGWIGWYTPLIVIVYALGVRQIYRRERKEAPHSKSVIYSGGESPKKVYLTFGLSAAFIIGAGVWLATIGDEIAATTGWAQGFVGSLFLAFTTTLPEITVSFAAMRMGAIDMAIANMVGSNLFNLTIIPIADIIYSREPLLANISESHLATAAAVFVMTLLFVIGLRLRPKRYLRLSWWSVIMIILFLLGAYFSFTLA
jgi:cation:H+ antiporter